MNGGEGRNRTYLGI